jgi:PAS domain S-box-containing protein
MEKAFRKTGIDIIGDAPWGTHLCQFYETREDLVDILVPYFKAGLENNEFCMWITSEPLKVEDAKAALKKVVKNLDHFIKKGQIEILDYSEWYTKSGKFDANNVLQGWVEKENQALKRGYDGLRLSGNTFWLAKRDWRNFTDYEEEINNVIGKYRMIAICTYSLGQCGASEVIDVVSNHQFALIRRDGKWVIIESSDRKQAEEILRESEERYRNLVESISDVVYAIDSSGVLTYISPVVKNTLGYEPDELIGRQFLEFVHKEDQDLLMRRFSDLRKGIVTHSDYRVIGKHGDIKWVRTLTNPIIEEGGFVGARGVLIDITERKRAEEALQFTRFSLDNAAETMVCVGHDGRFIDVNDAFCRFSGYSREELLSMTVHDIDPDYSAEIWPEFWEKLKQSGSLIFESCHRTKEGKVFPVEITANFFEYNGKEYHCSFARDITERKRAEEALREARDYLDHLIRYANAPIIVWDSSFRVIRFNHAFERLTGLKAGEVIGQELGILFPSASRDESLKKIKQTLSGEYWESVEIPILRNDGDIRLALWNSANIYAKDDRTLLATIAQGQDITERKRAEEKLKDSEEQYRKLFEDDLTGDFFATQEGTILDCNPSFLKMFGFGGKEEPLNTNFLDLYRSREEKEVFINQLREKKKLEFHECVLLKRDGTLINVIENIVGHFDEQGNLKQFKGYLFDITERKRGEAERERLMADLEAKNKELESFVYTISHDLKAPLVSLNGFSGALQKEYESQLGEEGRHYLERIQANVAHMEALIKSLLELSRIGQVVGAIEEIDVGPLLREIRDALGVRLKEAGAEFVVQEPLPTVCADRGRIHQVFANLIDNAVKFRSAERALRIEVGCRQESGFFRFHVADNGIGIAPQYHEQIFTPFRKLHPEIEGVGIGLAIVKKIVEHHGGRAWVESPSAEFTPSKPEGPGTGNEGAGVTFYFTLPIKHGVELLSRSSNLKGLS